MTLSKSDPWALAGSVFSAALFVVSGIFSFTLLETLVAPVFIDQFAIGTAAIAFEGSKAVLWVQGLKGHRPVLLATAVAFAFMSVIAASTSVLIKFDRGDLATAEAEAPKVALVEKRSRLLAQVAVEQRRLESTDTAYVKSPEATRAALSALEAEVDSVDAAIAALPPAADLRVNSRDQFDALRIVPALERVDFRKLYALCVALLIDVGAFTSAAAALRRVKKMKPPSSVPRVITTANIGAHLAYAENVFADGSVQTLCGRVIVGRVLDKGEQTDQPMCRGCSNLLKTQGGKS